MTSQKMPGVYFYESVATQTANVGEYSPLFIVQTSTEIAGLDGQYTYYTGLDAFETLVEDKGLTKTVACMEQVLREKGSTSFYVFSIKTDTAVGFTNAIIDSGHLLDVDDYVYIEESVSAQANTITGKTTAIKNGLDTLAESGIFRKAYIIPYATVNKAVTDAENTAPEETAITSLTSIFSTVSSGRIVAVLPDANAGFSVGKALNTPYDEDPGFGQILSNLETSEYKFTRNQQKTLMNLGILFLAEEIVQGTSQYRINLGVTTSFKDNKADGLIVCRTIVDEILRQIAFEAQGYVKGKEVEGSVSSLQTRVDTIIDTFVTDECIVRDGTSLTVADEGNGVFTIKGEIRPVKTIISIDVYTTIEA